MKTNIIEIVLYFETLSKFIAVPVYFKARNSLEVFIVWTFIQIFTVCSTVDIVLFDTNFQASIAANEKIY